MSKRVVGAKRASARDEAQANGATTTSRGFGGFAPKNFFGKFQMKKPVTNNLTGFFITTQKSRLTDRAIQNFLFSLFSFYLF